MGASVPPMVGPDTTPHRDLASLLPEVADSAASLQRAATAAGVHLTPVETRRSQDRQDYLYTKGRTAPGPQVTWTLHSNHTPGAAVDFVVNNDPTGRDPGYQWLQANAPNHGFNVLGPKDPGHVEMPSAVTRSQAPQPIPNARPGRATPTPIPNAGPRPATPTPLAAQSPTQQGASDPVADYLAARNGHGQSASDPVSDYLAALKAPSGGHGIHAEYASGRLAGRMARENANDAERTADESEPGYAQRALGGVASLARDIPGAEFLQAGARSVVRRQPYTEALSDIRGAEDAAPAAVTTLNRMAGAAPAFMAAPGSNMAKGAVLGALQGFTDADPEADRSQEVINRGVTGGVLGLVGDAAGAGGSKVLKMVKGQSAKEAKMAQAIAQFFGKGTAEPQAPTVIPRRFVAPGDSPPSPARIMQSKVGSLPDPEPAAIPRRFVTPRPGARPNLKVVPPGPTPTASPAASQSELMARIMAPTQWEQAGMPLKEWQALTPEARMNLRAGHAAPSTMDDALASLVGKMRAQQPGEVGNQIGDAELAMRAQDPPQSPFSLEELLRRSIVAKGGQPVAP